MRKLLFATLEYPPDIGGVGEYVAGLAGAFPGGTATVLAPTSSVERRSPETGAKVIRAKLSFRRLRPRWLAAVCALCRVVRREKPDGIVVTQLLPMGTVARFVARLHRIPYAVIVHGLDAGVAEAQGGRKRAEARRILAGAALVVANSAYTASLLEGMRDPTGIAVVHPAPAPLPQATVATMMRIIDRWPMTGHVILSAARLVRRKGMDTLIEAVAMLARKGTALTLFIVGDGPERQALETAAKASGAADSIRFVGPVSREELSVLYDRCDVFAMLPRQIGPDVEGFGIVYLEAAKKGKPSVATRTGGVPDAVIDGETGILVPPDDAAAAADAIARLVSDAPLRTRLGENARHRAEAQFGWERSAETFIKAWEKVTEQRI